jgi:molybdate transport system substrate-binding protein
MTCRTRQRAARAAWAFLSVTLCGHGLARAEPLRVAAAASLREAFQEIVVAYQLARPGSSVELNLGGSQLLRTQIEQGARVDVFASADVEQAAALKQQGLLRSYQLFASNRLVVVTQGPASALQSLQDLGRPKVRIVVAGPTVPAGRYTAEVLGRLGEPLRAEVESNIVSHETNVRGVLSKVLLGEADAGFVYATDAASAMGAIRVIEIPAGQNIVANYALGVMAPSTELAQAEALVELVLGPQGQEILRKHGFGR